MQNLIVMFTSSIFAQKCPFWAKLVQKIKIVMFSLKFGTLHQFEYAEFNCEVYFLFFRLETFSFFEQKYPFWANLIQKIKVVGLS